MPATCAGWVVPSTDAASDTTPAAIGAKPGEIWKTRNDPRIARINAKERVRTVIAFRADLWDSWTTSNAPELALEFLPAEKERRGPAVGAMVGVVGQESLLGQCGNLF